MSGTWTTIPDRDFEDIFEYVFNSNPAPRGQKAGISPMKFSVKVSSITTAIQAKIDAANKSYTDAKTKFDAGDATAQSVVTANAATIAVASGFVNPDGTPDTATFLKSPSFKQVVFNVKVPLGLSRYAPSTPSIAPLQNDLALLAALDSSQTTIELEEGHRLLSYLNQ